MRNYILLFILFCTGAGSACGQAAKRTRPSQAQLKWADSEIGAMFHLDMQVFEPGYLFRANWNYQPDVSIFNPAALNTDQWIKAVKAAGATYAILVAKHCSGFSLWPTSAHGYSVKNAPWKNGKGDIVKEFIASCKKYGIKPGIYASTSVNAYLHVNNPGRVISGDAQEQEKYKEVIKTQLTELWSHYGKLFEIWFDGGVLPPDKGGIDMQALLKKYQPDAIAFQGPYGYENNVRYVGNENGVAPYPCWGRADSVTTATGVIEIKGLNGNPNGQFWCPGETDFALRKNAYLNGWFWHEGEDNKIRTLDDMMDRYRESVGRNTNMLLGVVINRNGLVPDADVKRLEEFGVAVKQQFLKAIGTVSGKGNNFVVNFTTPQSVTHVMLMEDISDGERVLEYNIYGMLNGAWQLVSKGSCIGHKRIETLGGQFFSAIKLEIVKSDGLPSIKKIACFANNKVEHSLTKY